MNHQLINYTKLVHILLSVTTSLLINKTTILYDKTEYLCVRYIEYRYVACTKNGQTACNHCTYIAVILPRFSAYYNTC